MYVGLDDSPGEILLDVTSDRLILLENTPSSAYNQYSRNLEVASFKEMYDEALESVLQLEYRMETTAERPPLTIPPGVFLHYMDAENAIETTFESVTGPHETTSPPMRSSIFPDWVKLLKSCESPLGGMILADATGLGKSLTVLVAALKKRKQMLAYCGPVLVVTYPSCAHQWFDEIETHFSEESQPQATIVNRHDVDIDVLLEHDVLICTSSFLKARYLDRIKLEGFLAVASAHGIRVANTMFLNQNYQHIHLPLHSEIFQNKEKVFPVIIIDEAHDAKNADLLLSQAVRNLPY
ncbi:hypothetical protein FAVG1_12982 [Fusarium avenaceum]|nr:hypothetical protein FAVG1_12982 [Fusarium avenaceum]